MSSTRRISAFLVVFLCLHFFHPSPAAAQELVPKGPMAPTGEAVPASPTANWAPQWGRPGWFDAALAAAFVGGSLGIKYGIGRPTTPRWVGPTGPDRWMHDALLPSTRDGQLLAGRASDVLLVSSIAAPLILGPGIEWLAHGKSETAKRLALIDTEALTFALFSSTAIKHLVGRQRPPLGTCWGNNSGPECDKRDTLSFPSGHTTMAFTGAGLVCLNAEELHPLGGNWDKVACYSALGAATATGVLRMVSDSHYLTDVVAGAALGLASGYLLPKFLYFGFGGHGGLLGDYNATVTPTVGAVNGVSMSMSW